MTLLLVADLARWFWEAAGEPEPFPRELRRAIARALPLGIVELPRLGLRRLAEWLQAREVSCQLGTAGDRPLRAALVALRGHGLIFLDGTDPPDERRFSLAHEAAHFLVDHWWPRQRIERRVGPRALEVLDGDRPPDRVERIDAALAGLSLQLRIHLMERTPSGHIPHAVIAQAEATADALALELLAPEAEARATLRTARGDLEAALAARFGLPPAVAAAYLQQLRPARSSPPLLRALRLMDGGGASQTGQRPRNSE